MSLELKEENILGWKVRALEFQNDKKIIKTVFRGQLYSSQTKPGKDKKFVQQQQITNAIKLERGSEPRNDLGIYAISLGMNFSQPENQNQPLDIDNFLKPIFAGIAGGLFSPIDKNPTVDDFQQYDDSRFKYLIVERLDDHAVEEGVAIVISEK